MRDDGRIPPLTRRRRSAPGDDLSPASQGGGGVRLTLAESYPRNRAPNTSPPPCGGEVAHSDGVGG
jgi:hypothetical protein